MVEMMRRIAAPVVRLSTVREVGHGEVFDAFADNLAGVLVERRARDEPRVVSLRARGAR
ncbi:hypothetical protein [Acuticoccus kandeliae]|uniref:hypothetical protein n=1 Tax=Acuticoccus kandeliae TaxID=2073160 RepID=UPI001300857C|nr:hypothetical protein [Acuticoccus kandeliae]